MNQLNDLLQRLVVAGVEFVLVGGYAAVVHGVSFVTQDVDICLRLSAGNLGRLESALAGLPPKHRMTHQKLPFTLSPDTRQNLQNLHLQTD